MNAHHARETAPENQLPPLPTLSLRRCIYFNRLQNTGAKLFCF